MPLEIPIPGLPTVITYEYRTNLTRTDDTKGMGDITDMGCYEDH